MAKVYGEIVADVAKESTSQEILESLQGEGTERLILSGSTYAVTAYNTVNKFNLFELYGSGKIHWIDAQVYLDTPTTNGGDLSATSQAHVKVIVDGVTVMTNGQTLSTASSSALNKSVHIGNPKFLVPYANSSTNGYMYPNGSVILPHTHVELGHVEGTANNINHFLANYLKFNESVVIEVTALYKNNGNDNKIANATRNAKYSVGYTLDE